MAPPRPPTRDSPAPALVVDDDHAVASLLCSFLERLGLGVTVAHGAAEAKEQLARDEPWALMVTDLELGGYAGGEGLALLSECRRRWPQCRSILVSGSAGPEIAEEARARGADLFLSKPFSMGDLAAAVRSLLGV